MRVLFPFTLLLACGPAPDDSREPSTVRMAFAAEPGGEFWSAPWPADRRTDAEGRPDLSGFPNPGASTFLAEYLAYGTAQIQGFGLASPAWLPMSGPVALPTWDWEWAALSGRCLGPVRLIDVDPDSPQRGSCLPARWQRVPLDGTDPFEPPGAVVVAPAWGFPRASGRTYAIVLSDVQDEGGLWVPASPELLAALAGGGTDPWTLSFAPLAETLAANPSLAGTTGELQWIAGATVFTTQDAAGEMRRLTDFVRGDAALPAWTGELEMIPEDHPEHQLEYDMWDGAYTAYNFQRGEIPYADEGGGFVWDADGKPVPQWEERIPFAIGMPVPTFTQPESGWPVILHQHGTGGDRWSHLTGGSSRPGLLGARRGFLSVAIPQPIHDERWPDGNELAVELNSFNYLNPESGRSMFRQGALDLVALHRFVAEQLGPGGAVALAHPDLRIDPDRIYFVGHSQGGLTGSLALPFVPEIRGWVLSGAGAGIAITVMQRQDPLNIADAVITALGSPDGAALHDLHPVVGLVQWLAETTDPIAYAPLWNADPEHATDILLTEGIHDTMTVADASEALATAGRLPLARPYDVRTVPSLELLADPSQRVPYSGNVGEDGAATTGLAQFDADHFAIFQDADAALLWVNFLYSNAAFGAPGELGYQF